MRRRGLDAKPSMRVGRLESGVWAFRGGTMNRAQRTVAWALAVSVALLAAQPLIAQEWTAEEQEVLNQLESCWATWWDAIAEENLDVWARGCPHDDQVVGWWVDGAVPGLGIEWFRRNFETLARIQKPAIPRLWENRPVLVRVRGDSAVVFYYLRLGGQDEADGLLWRELKRAEWFYRKDGRWLLAAAMEASR
jgi:hypothetical protein